MHLLTHSIILKALGWWLFNSLWQMGLLWLIYVSFTFVFRRAAANARHGLALLLLTAGTGWSIVSFLGYFIPGSLPDETLQIILPGHRIIEEMQPYCATIYLAVLSFLFIRYVNQYFYTRRLRQTGLSRVAPELRLFTTETALHMGIRRKVAIWLSTQVEAPLTLGLFKPIILLPLTTVTHLTTAQVEAILLHELAHIRRNDYLLNLGICALEQVFFFNPFARLLIRRIKKEREHRCDDIVLQFRHDPRAYASALLSLATPAQDRSRLVLAATGGNDQLLLQRVRRILKVKDTGERQTGRGLLFLVFPLVAALLAFNFSHHIPEAKTSIPTGPATSPITTTQGGTATPVLSESPATQPAAAPLPPATVPAKLPSGSPTHLRALTVTVTRAEAVEAPILIVADDQPDNEENNDIVLASQQTPPAEIETGTPAINYARDVKVRLAVAHRDYSIATTNPNPALKIARDLRQLNTAQSVYVPNTSFLYHCDCDTSRPDPQYIYRQQQAVKQLQEATLKMQKEFQIQLRIIQQAQAKANKEATIRLNQILIAQVKLQQQYLQKQHELQQRLERTVNKRVIVAI